nr:translation initiation factor IF-2-like [Aegilops tauschii subsp. strangulata]
MPLAAWTSSSSVAAPRPHLSLTASASTPALEDYRRRPGAAMPSPDLVAASPSSSSSPPRPPLPSPYRSSELPPLLSPMRARPLPLVLSSVAHRCSRTAATGQPRGAPLARPAPAGAPWPRASARLVSALSSLPWRRPPPPPLAGVVGAGGLATPVAGAPLPIDLGARPVGRRRPTPGSAQRPSARLPVRPLGPLGI